jgi:2-keto-3-deoxy-L-rhamnonate aldolase RhmA
MPVAIRAARGRPHGGRGTGYVLHFATRYHDAGHYVGYTEDLPAVSQNTAQARVRGCSPQ